MPAEAAGGSGRLSFEELLAKVRDDPLFRRAVVERPKMALWPFHLTPDQSRVLKEEAKKYFQGEQAESEG